MNFAFTLRMRKVSVKTSANLQLNYPPKNSLFANYLPQL